MSGSITTHFTEEFTQELYVAFQNKGGVMRPRTRRKSGVIGSRVHFPKIATAPVAQPKTRRGKVPTMDIVRSRVQCDLTDYYASDFIDDLDQLKTNVEEKTALQNAIVMSLARSEDDVAKAQLATSNNANNSLGANDTWTTDATPRQILEQFGAADAMEAGMMHALVTWRTWNDLLSLNSFINSDFGGDPMLTSEGQRSKMYFGFAYAPWSRLPIHSSTFPINMWFNSRCIGVAVGKEISPSSTWNDEYDAWYVKGKMSLGACLIDATGVILRRYNG
jgi:hypothetical protein